MEQVQEKFQITSENYHSQSVNQRYLSHSQIRAFQTCQSQWRAQYIDGDHERVVSEAMHVGTYTDIALLDGHAALCAWVEENVEIVLTTKGKKREAFNKADEMIKAVKGQSVLANYLGGERKVILTGKIHGLNFKGELDVIDHSEPRIVDLKTVGGKEGLREKSWRDVSYLPDRRSFFYDFYWLQLAIYRELYHLKFNKYPNCYIVAVSKQSPPDVELYRMNNIGKFKDEIDSMKPWIDLLKQVDMGEKEPTRCEKCEWCRSTNRIVEPVVITGE